MKKDKQDKDLEEDESSKAEVSLRWDLIDEMVHSLGRAWPNSKETQGTVAMLLRSKPSLF